MTNSTTKIADLFRSWTTFWVMIISMVVSFAVTYTTLSNKVQAMEDKEVILRKDLENNIDILMEVRESQIRMEVDIEYIKKKIN